MKNWLYSFILLLTLSACNSGEGPATTTATNAETSEAAAGTEENNDQYETEAIPGSDVVVAIKHNNSGNIVEKGFLDNGVKTGTWLIFEKRPFKFPNKIITYLNGQYNGPYYEMNERGQIELSAYYVNNQLDGAWGKYKFGRPTAEAQYKAGQLDGVYKEYFLKDGSLQKEIHYLQGKQHGPYRFYNEEGEITLEYEYKYGEKVGGGIVEPHKPEASN